MLAAAAPALAGTVMGTSDLNPLGDISLGGSLGFDTTLTPADGIDGGTYDRNPAATYFDYIFSFELKDAAKLNISAHAATDGGDPDDFHAVLFSQSPQGTDLNTFEGHSDPTHPLNDTLYDGIDISTGDGFEAGGSTCCGGSLVTLQSGDLGIGTYYIRLFGVLPSGVTLAGLSGSIAATMGTTPIPPALLLFLSGLGALGFIGRRKAATAA